MTTPTSSDTGYSSGASLYIVDHDVDGWQRRLQFLRGLPGLTHVALWLEQLDLDSEEQTRLRDALAGLRVVVHAPCLQLSMISHHDVVRGAAAEVSRRALKLAVGLSAEVITVIAGARPFFMDETVAVAQTRAMIGSLRDHLAQLGGGARLSLRNQTSLQRGAAPGSLTEAPLSPFPAALEELSACLSRTPEVGVTLDIGASTANREGWLGFLRAEVNRICDLHLHDAQPGGATHLALGSGAVDAFALARILRSSDYRGFVTLAVGGRSDTQRSWDLWCRATDEAAQDHTASLPPALR